MSYYGQHQPWSHQINNVWDALHASQPTNGPTPADDYAFAYQFDEVDRAQENLLRGGKSYAMTNRQYRLPPTASLANNALRPMSDMDTRAGLRPLSGTFSAGPMTPLPQQQQQQQQQYGSVSRLPSRQSSQRRQTGHTPQISQSQYQQNQSVQSQLSQHQLNQHQLSQHQLSQQTQQNQQSQHQPQQVGSMQQSLPQRSSLVRGASVHGSSFFQGYSRSVAYTDGREREMRSQLDQNEDPRHNITQNRRSLYRDGPLFDAYGNLQRSGILPSHSGPASLSGASPVNHGMTDRATIASTSTTSLATIANTHTSTSTHTNASTNSSTTHSPDGEFSSNMSRGPGQGHAPTHPPIGVMSSGEANSSRPMSMINLGYPGLASGPNNEPVYVGSSTTASSSASRPGLLPQAHSDMSIHSSSSNNNGHSSFGLLSLQSFRPQNHTQPATQQAVVHGQPLPSQGQPAPIGTRPLGTPATTSSSKRASPPLTSPSGWGHGVSELWGQAGVGAQSVWGC